MVASQPAMFEWPSAEGGPKIYLSPDVARELARRVTESANALPRRGLEVGGLLLGKQTADEIHVEALAPLECGYPDGPAFRVGEAELRDALQAVKESGEVVGIYRSRTDGVLEIDHQDELLLRLLQRHPMPVLMIRQRKDVAGEGRLLIKGVTSAGEIFPIKEWLAGVWQPPEPVLATPLSHDREGAVVKSKAGHNTRAWIAAVAAAVLLAPFAAWQVSRTRSTDLRSSEPRQVAPSVPAPTAARPAPSAAAKQPEVQGAVKELSRSGNDDPGNLAWLKKWIRSDQSELVRQAAMKELARRWKDDPETLPLLKDRARSDDSELVRAAALQELAHGWRQDPGTLALLKDRARSDQNSTVRQAAQELARDWNEGPDTRTRVGEPLMEPAKQPVKQPIEVERESTERRAVRRFQPPPPRTGVPQGLELSRPAPSQMAVNRLDLHSFQASPLLPAPSGAAPPAVVYTQPVLAHQPRPVRLPPDLRRFLQNEIVLSLRISIDANGRVSNVYPTAETSRAERALWSFYGDAVRSWVFEPARRNNVPVPGETILRFRVTPDVSR